VTPWIRSHPTAKKGNVSGPDPDLAQACRWTLDFPEDYEFLTALFDLLPPAPAIPSIDQVLAILTINPNLAEINAMHHGVRAKK
jgi:spore coat polysaccharide biosynthesis protein SpsF (cytidylyltransferase family)